MHKELLCSNAHLKYQSTISDAIASATGSLLVKK
jgi:hypothetical protein